MSTKYEIQQLVGGWVVTMTASQQIVAKYFANEDEAKAVMQEFERGRREVDEKQEVWVIGEAFVMEPSVSGLQLGEVADLDMRQFTVVRRLSEAEFDALVEEFFPENGHYPDS